MSASIAPAVDGAGFELPQPRAFGAGQSLRSPLASLMRASAEQLVTPRHDVPREWFRFPLP